MKPKVYVETTVLSYPGAFPLSTLFKSRIIEFQSAAVLGYGANDVVWRAGWDVRINLDGDVHLGIEQARQVRDHGTCNYIDIPRQACGVDCGRPVEAAHDDWLRRCWLLRDRGTWSVG